ncbi:MULTISPECIES: MliC family protein [Vibrio]|uniref:C-type lysozyme inhibitor domain-containing protein n=1 Tax=Vibrio mediterranei TaxID=689 RepID=A0ABX5DGB7_9VIBR|nr:MULTISPECIES: MliC family protein [Vibrio]MCG9664434.1 MliC family protein [Vibrio mediterranei]MCY9869441.1 MliC family protein [Vibrio barjaei]NOI24270.1 lysozyme inhibitor [Vibrio mediterranei]PCD90400.1 hypothetical protein COR52_03880 [Vibrio mediterranei]PRQ67631.1 hypothetical protein COR51_11305 [Vibrio mediterranei]
MMLSIAKKTLLPVLLVSGLAACSSGGQTESAAGNYHVLQYECDSQNFQVTQLSSEQILLLIDKTEYPLHRVPSASGVRYTLDGESQTDSNIELFSKGREGMLTMNGVTDKSCRMTTRSIPKG